LQRKKENEIKEKIIKNEPRNGKQQRKVREEGRTSIHLTGRSNERIRKEVSVVMLIRSYRFIKTTGVNFEIHRPARKKL